MANSVTGPHLAQKSSFKQSALILFEGSTYEKADPLKSYKIQGHNEI